MNRKLLIVILSVALTGLTAQCSSPVEKGNALFFEGRYTEALRYYSNVFTERIFADQIPYATFLSARCYLEMGNRDMALRALWQLVGEYPESQWADNAYLELAHIRELEGKNKLGEALVLYETIPFKYPRSEVLAEALLGAARVKIGMNYHAFAHEDMRKVVEKFGSFEETAQIHYDIASIYAHPQNPHRDIDKALEHLSIVTTRFPNSDVVTDSYLYLARLNWETGNRSEALQFFNEILTRESGKPEAEYAQEAIARIYEEIGDLQRAVNAYRILLVKFNYADITRQRFQSEIDRFTGVSTTSDKPVISAWSAEEDESRKRIQYTGDVEIMIHDGVIRADKAVVDFTENAISASGNIRITWNGRHLIYCDTLKYDVQKKQVRCLGNVFRKERTPEGVLEMQHDKILFSFSDGNITSEGN
jgi:tetratricopeptide (TPR) repeat protein